MKKFFMFLCIVIMFFGIVGCPSSNDPAPVEQIKHCFNTSYKYNRWWHSCSPRARYTYTAWLWISWSCRIRTQKI